MRCVCKIKLGDTVYDGGFLAYCNQTMDNSGEEDDEWDQDTVLRELPLALSTRKLYIRDANDTSLGVWLDQLFNPLSAPETLHYETSEWNSIFGFEPPIFFKSLRPLRRSLQFLRIVKEWDCPHLRHYQCHPIGSLACFHRLTSIDMNALMMIGFDSATYYSTHNDNPLDWDMRQKFPSKQSLKECVPRTLESLTLRHCDQKDPAPILTDIYELISQKEAFAPALKRLDLEWARVVYPDKPSPEYPSIHPGFTREEATELMNECQVAGVEMVVNARRHKQKKVQWEEEEGYYKSRIFDYPYNGYEECCKRHGCDPETGTKG